MSAAKVFGVILLIAGIILFFANVGTVIDVAGDMIKGISNDSGSNNQSQNNGGSTKTTDNTYATKAKAVSSAIEPRNSTVRALALNAIKKSNNGEYNIGQVCDIFDYLYNNWTYVNDPSGSGEYFAKASESAKLMKGDCDDFAILMASCIEAIGGTARVNLAQSTTSGHAYTEVYVTDNASDLKNICNQISKRYGGKTINWRSNTNSNGKTDYWLNLDWWANHPGGEYYNSVGTIISIKSNGAYKLYNS